jgi:hypothetical protein
MPQHPPGTVLRLVPNANSGMVNKEEDVAAFLAGYKPLSRASPNVRYQLAVELHQQVRTYIERCIVSLQRGGDLLLVQ